MADVSRFVRKFFVPTVCYVDGPPFTPINAMTKVENSVANASENVRDQAQRSESEFAVTESVDHTKVTTAPSAETSPPQSDPPQEDHDAAKSINVSKSEQEVKPECLTETAAIPDRIEMTSEVFNQIKHTIGKKPAETGGILGMSGEKIDHFFYDRLPDGATSVTYTPNCDAINAVLKRWTRKDAVYMGAIHSHPKGYNRPSYADEQYARRLLDNNLNFDKAKPYFYIPIVQPSADATGFELFSYIAYYKNDRFSVEPIDLYIDGQKYEPNISVPLENFSRIRLLFPAEIMSQKTVISIGAGGARSYLENLARSGVGNIVLIDGDGVSETNIGTQAVFYSELGRSKVEAIRERVLDINPEANVTCVAQFLTDDMSDDDFLNLVGESCKKSLKVSPQDVLIVGTTDNFFANARANRLALKYGSPFLGVGIYQNGAGGEIAFTYPGITPACYRCCTAGRYRHYANGGHNDATSEGAPIFSTEVVNGMKGFISLMLLLHNTDTRFGAYLKEYATRNFLQMNFDPFSELFPGIPIGQGKYFEQKPDHPTNGYEECPDCHGTGNLEDVKGSIDDTRKIFN